MTVAAKLCQLFIFWLKSEMNEKIYLIYLLTNILLLIDIWRTNNFCLKILKTHFKPKLRVLYYKKEGNFLPP